MSPKFSEKHSADTCCTTDFKCAICSGPHEASSKNCSTHKTELKVLKHIVKDNSMHREAAAKGRRRAAGAPKAVTGTDNKVSGDAVNTSSANAWPALPALSPPAEQRPTSDAPMTAQIACKVKKSK